MTWSTRMPAPRAQRGAQDPITAGSPPPAGARGRRATRPQSWPSVLNSSGGAPTAPAGRTGPARARRPRRCGRCPMARSCSRPQPSPAAASWRRAATEASVERDAAGMLRGEGATPGVSGRRCSGGHSHQGRRWCSARAQNVAKRRSSAPSRARKASRSPSPRTPAQIRSSASPLSAITASRSIRGSSFSARPARSRSARARRAAHGLGHGGDVQVERVAVQAARRRVRARLRRPPGHVRVKRVDQERAGAARARPGRQAPRSPRSPIPHERADRSA